MGTMTRAARVVRAGAACLLVAVGVGCAGNARPNLSPQPLAPTGSFVAADVVAEVKDFAVTLGSQATGNFVRSSDRRISDTRCYFTGKLQLPEFYSTLSMVREEEEQCTARATENDVFFYPVQAVASGEETITVSLAEASTERLLVVVPHEDFHSQREARKAPTEVAEAAATLVGFLTASEFATDRFGADSTTARSLAGDANLFLEKSVLVNQYYDRVRSLYHSFESGALTREQTLERKAELFHELQRACGGIAPEPVSFNKCPAAMNNAGLAFDRTYTAYYPMLHDLYSLLGGDTPALVSTLKRLMENWPSYAAKATDLIDQQ
jgi:predicted aminopeptidase